MVGTAKVNNLKEVTTLQYTRGRFCVTEAVDTATQNTQAALEVMDMQNKQIDMLYDMIRNISGSEKLFHKEFDVLASEVYEKIRQLQNR